MGHNCHILLRTNNAKHKSDVGVGDDDDDDVTRKE